MPHNPFRALILIMARNLMPGNGAIEGDECPHPNPSAAFTMWPDDTAGPTTLGRSEQGTHTHTHTHTHTCAHAHHMWAGAGGHPARRVADEASGQPPGKVRTGPTHASDSWATRYATYSPRLPTQGTAMNEAAKPQEGSVHGSQGVPGRCSDTARNRLALCIQCSKGLQGETVFWWTSDSGPHLPVPQNLTILRILVLVQNLTTAKIWRPGVSRGHSDT